MMHQESHPLTLVLAFSLHLMAQTTAVTFPTIAGRVGIINHSEYISATALSLLCRSALCSSGSHSENFWHLLCAALYRRYKPHADGSCFVKHTLHAFTFNRLPSIIARERECLPLGMLVGQFLAFFPSPRGDLVS